MEITVISFTKHIYVIKYDGVSKKTHDVTLHKKGLQCLLPYKFVVTPMKNRYWQNTILIQCMDSKTNLTLLAMQCLICNIFFVVHIYVIC